MPTISRAKLILKIPGVTGVVDNCVELKINLSEFTIQIVLHNWLAPSISKLTPY